MAKQPDTMGSTEEPVLPKTGVSLSGVELNLGELSEIAGGDKVVPIRHTVTIAMTTTTKDKVETFLEY
jgi:hypothetical protein